MDDLISREAAIDFIDAGHLVNPNEPRWSDNEVVGFLKSKPSAQPRITDEQAIEHLRSTGWMQNHDREMYDMGLKEQLADDSGSYDSLLPSAQPEPQKWLDHNYYLECPTCARYVSVRTPFCPYCGGRNE